MEIPYYLITTFAAATYNCGAYGVGEYNSCGTTTLSGTNDGSSSGLAPTGQAILAPLIGGLLLIIIALVLLAKTMKRKTNKR
jgi:hypothetical protein